MLRVRCLHVLFILSFAPSASYGAQQPPKYLVQASRDHIGRVWVPVMINQKGPFRFALDTASDSSAIVASALTKLGIAVPAKNSVRIHGITGTALVPSIIVDSMTIGNFAMRGVRLPIVTGVFGGADGVLGIRAWSNLRISLDFQNDEVRISPSNTEKAPAGYVRIPILETKEKLLLIEVSIGDLRTKAILDTGAQQSLGNYLLRSKLIRDMSTPKEHLVEGVTLDTARGELVEVPPLSLGGIKMSNVHVIFGDMSIFERWKLNDEPILLLGMDVIGALGGVIIDYEMKEIFIRPPATPNP